MRPARAKTSSSGADSASGTTNSESSGANSASGVIGTASGGSGVSSFWTGTASNAANSDCPRGPMMVGRAHIHCWNHDGNPDVPGARGATRPTHFLHAKIPSSHPSILSLNP